MASAYRISQVASQLGVTPHYLRLLEWEGRIPPVQRDFNGRVYTEFDLALLRALGVGQRPCRLRRPEEALEEAR